MRNIHGVLILVLTVCMSTLLCSGCKEYSVVSSWYDREISIDGSDSDWRNATVHNEYTNCALGVMNDSKNLYISITPWGRKTQGQIITSGLTVWFDKTGKEKKTQGITFPLPGTFHDGLRQMTTQRTEAEHLLKEFAESQKELLLIESDGQDTLTVSLKEARDMGIEIAVGDSDGRLSYELKVPLYSTGSGLFSLLSNPGDEIHVGFETGNMPTPNEDEDSFYRQYIRNGERTSTLISDRSKRSDRTYQPIADRQRSEPFLFWVSIDLAKRKP